MEIYRAGAVGYVRRPRAVFGLLVLLLAIGCDQGTDPPGPGGVPDDPFTYLPLTERLAIPCGGHIDLSVQGEGTGSVAWRTSSGQTGRGIRFRAFSRRWLPDTVQVVVDTAGLAMTHHWILDPIAALASDGFTPRGRDVVGIWRFPKSFAFYSECEAPDITWSVNGYHRGTGPDFSFVPDRIDIYEVTADLAVADTVFTRTWLLDVVSPGASLLYSPSETSPEIFETRSQFFSVSAEYPLPEVIWQVDGAPAGMGPTLVYAGEVPGLHEIEVAVVLPDTTIHHLWQLDVLEVAEGRPPAVTDVTILDGPRLGQTTLHWSPVIATGFPVVSYEARYSLDGPVTPENWPLAQLLGTGTWPAGAVRYDLTVWNEDMHWATGQEICLAVRARDDHGTLSDLPDNACLQIDNDWWIRGHVTGPDGQPAEGVRVRDMATGPTTYTDASGNFTAGPFRPQHAVPLQFDGLTDDGSGLEWVPWDTPEMTAQNAYFVNVRLLPEYGADATCGQFHEMFSRYLRLMTLTFNPLRDRPNVNLYKWNEYPVDVYIPEFTGEGGIDYAAACRAVIDIWNTS
ncbi:hypothetical protein DRQ50_04370, partial [bacterium]